MVIVDNNDHSHDQPHCAIDGPYDYRNDRWPRVAGALVILAVVVIVAMVAYS